MLSFRVEEEDARAAQAWADRLNVDRSELLRAALRRHLLRLASEVDAEIWQQRPLETDELSLRRSPPGDRRRNGPTGPMQRGDAWFAATSGGDRPVLVLTRDPVADRIGSVVVAALTHTVRGLVSELELTPADDGVPTPCVANFDNLHTLPQQAFRRRVTSLTPARMAAACRVLQAATGC